MRGLFFKVFIIFWIAQSLIFVISTALIVRRHFEGPEAQFDMLDSSLQSDAKAAAAAWETGGCAALQAYGAGIAQTIALEDATGQLLCKTAGTEAGIAGFEQNEPAPDAHHRTPRSASNTCGGCPSYRPAGKHYVFLLSRPHVPRKPRLVAGSVAFLVPAAPGGHCHWRTHDVCAGAAVHAPGDQAQKGCARTGNGKAECPRGVAQVAGAHLCRRRNRRADARLQSHGRAAGVARGCAEAAAARRFA